MAAIYRIVEDYLGLKRTHSSRLLSLRRQEARTSSSSHNITLHNRVNTTEDSTVRLSPPLPLEEYAGTYVDPGYPNITFCAPNAVGNSLECQFALEQFAHLENVTHSQTLYIIIPSIWLSHGRAHYKETEGRTHVFGLSGTYLFPHGYGKDTSPFETWHEGDNEVALEFVLEEEEAGKVRVVGAGLRGLVGEMTERERIGGSVQETAEVWFVKV